LLDKLVEKGVLTVKEANELKEETDKDFTKAYQAKSGMPEWVTAFKINGDMRGRIEGFMGDDTDGFTDRWRFRYRLRLGATTTLWNNFEAGLRLTSSDPAQTFGGDPISGNTTFQDNASKKFLYLDTAYGKWSFLNTPEFTSSVTVGKMDNPFQLSDMVYDADYTPEGANLMFTYRVNDQHTLKFTGAAFVLDELSASSSDPNLLGGQVRWDATWSPKLSSSLTAAFMSIQNIQFLTNGAVPNINRGNTRVGPTGELAYHFNPVIAEASLTYSLPEFPLYKGAFPIRLFGDYINNPAAPSSAGNQAWEAGIGFGKAGKKGLWELSYRYKYLGANAWYEEMTDSDFGAFYQAGLANSGFGTGYGAGTNTRGHVAKASWSPYDGFALTATYFLTELIREQPPGSNSGIGRLQVDAMWKF
jgi:hypothetical protein